MTNDSNRTLTRRSALVGVAGIGLASAGAGAGTFAYFSDAETSSGNSIQAGTMELDVSNGYSFEYAFKDVAPGDTTAQAYVGDGWAKRNLSFNGDAVNTGSVDAACLAVYIGHETTPGEGRDGSSMEDELEIEVLSWEGYDYVDGFEVLGESEADLPGDFGFEVDGDDFFDVFEAGESLTLADLSERELRLNPSPRTNGDPSSDGRTFHYDFRVGEGMGNEYQGAELITDVHFALLQDESQTFDGTVG
ncbi:TasA family protein [Halostagnicola bangensis]